MKGDHAQRVRCAIYTRKSSDEGLEQDFNSLDAQREACAAYILSQTSEGWSALPDRYDDGGISGGTLERPALRRLLSDVAAGRVDTIVVYKVDRLTRSLTDFSKLVEAFDTAGTSFVSVTQSFNTTTSMGRLTLNMLLSFAQFEREVTAERIRDKIAASKAKGMWMGGIPPLGYAPDGRSLKVVEDHAALVRTVFALYLELGSVRAVAERLARDNVRTPTRIVAKNGKTFGGTLLGRGQIYKLLGCATYIGEVHHKGQVYPGLHQGIVDRDMWDRTQAQLASNLQGHRDGVRAARPSLLARKVVDAEGKPLIATHVTTRGKRYRYYISRDLQSGATTIGLRIPAHELETFVTDWLVATLSDPVALATACGLELTPAAFQRVRDAGIDTLESTSRRAMIRDLVERVRVDAEMITIACSTSKIAALLGMTDTSDAPATIDLTFPARLSRSGLRMRLVEHHGAPLTPSLNPALVKLLVKARRWWSILREGQLTIDQLGTQERVKPAYVTRVLRLAFLSPAVVEAILAGRQSEAATVTELTLGAGVEASWAMQRASLT